MVLLSISAQYGERRILALTQEVEGFTYEGLLATTPHVPFDLRRQDLLHYLESYALEEERGGLECEFLDAQHHTARLTAVEALEAFRKRGSIPLSRWQTHLYRCSSDSKAV